MSERVLCASFDGALIQLIGTMNPKPNFQSTDEVTLPSPNQPPHISHKTNKTNKTKIKETREQAPGFYGLVHNIEILFGSMLILVKVI